MIGTSPEEGREERPVPVSHAPEMIPAERRARIVEALEAQRSVKVATLSEALGVSEITIRRDLVILGREGLLARTYGGAVLRKRSTDDSGPEGDEPDKAAEAARIARAAAAMIEPRDTVFLGSGATVAQILRYVDPGLEARVVTHSLAAAAESRGLRLEMVFLGGLYRPQLNAVEGTWPIDMIGQFHADKAFLGADGLDSKAGLTTPSIAVAGVELAMIRRTRGEVVVLAHNNRIGLVCQVVICPLDQIDVVLVDTGLDREVLRDIRRAGPRCEVV
jgi:DeoR/GlpR family transcriptional regulator of sugar metabolism